MSIEKLFSFGFKAKETYYASSLRRSTAAMLDVWIVLVLRMIVAQIVGMLWMNEQLHNFLLQFRTEFGTDEFKNTPEHLNFFIHHPLFYYMLIFYALIIMVGGAYHAYLNSSVWCGTVGKRIMKIVLIKENGVQISFGRGLLHYFLSVLPFAFLFYLVTYQLRYKLNLYQALTASDINIALSILFVLWAQIHLFTKKKVTVYDLICRTVTANGKTSTKWPWS
ncbi:MAG: RDD family protein [Alphaproteobacteria bacterium]|nr:RDD family protein [Alphaproteobacteria bacterium]